MPKFPEPAGLERIPPLWCELPAGSLVWRLYSRGGRHPATWDGFRTYGPIPTARFDHHLAKSGVPLLVDFWAPWCGPCRTMAPEFEKAAAALEPAARLVKVNSDEEPALAERFGVRSIPTIVLAFEGRELARLAGARSAAQLTEWVRQQLSLQEAGAR